MNVFLSAFNTSSRYATPNALVYRGLGWLCSGFGPSLWSGLRGSRVSRFYVRLLPTWLGRRCRGDYVWDWADEGFSEEELSNEFLWLM